MTAQYLQWLESPVIKRYSGRLPRLLSFLLLILCAYTAAQLVWLFVTPAPELPVLTTARQPARTPQQQSPNHASQIASLHLFGTQEVKSQPQQPIEAPETRLNLKLHGVFAVEDESKGLALIAGSSGPEKMYAVGAKIPGNITLTSVHPDRVILQRNGQYEPLRLPETETTGMDFVPTAANIGNNTSMSPGSADDRTRLRDIRRDFMRNPAKLAELVRVAPVNEDGKTTGFSLTALTDDPLFNELGFQSGDVVKSVNGVTLDSSAKGLRVLQQLRRAKQVNVTIERNGQLVEMNHSF